MIQDEQELRRSMSTPSLDVQPLDTTASFRTQAYNALKAAITQMDIYDHDEEIRLDERQLSEKLGVSRTPIREAMTLLEQEGFVRSSPRRGVFVVRKTKRELLEMVVVWATLESMAARMAAQNASDEEIASLRKLFRNFEKSSLPEHMGEYSDANISFHKQILRMSGCKLIVKITDNLFIHMRAIRKVTIAHDDRAQRSIDEHMRIIEALEARDANLAERLVRDHTLGLAEHIEKHCDFLA
jgi:DNA-binding GntR family transcriptional regulator